MKKQISSDGFKSSIASITEKMIECVKLMNEGVIENDSRKELEYRSKLSAYDLALFSINLRSTIVDEKAQDGSVDPNSVPF